MMPDPKKRTIASDPRKRDKKGQKPPARGTVGKKPLRKSPDEEMITPEVLEFIAAIEEYKKRHNRPFPTWSEILKILTDLGYRRDPRKSQGVA